MRARRALVLVAASIAVAAPLLAPSGALAAAKLPKPGTAEQVAKLVAQSSSIKSLPKGLVPPLIQVASDNPGAYYPAASRACLSITKCVFGDHQSKKTLVLFGDSHAQMWLPALVPVARADDYRLVLLWEPGCPAASVSVWDMGTHSINHQCNYWRTRSIAAIRKLAPAVVLLASRTSDIPGPMNQPTTDAMWESGLEATISQLKSSKTTVAVIGDITVFSPIDITECLAAYPSDVQSCSVKNPNGYTRQHFAAEMAAAKAEDVTYLDTQQWLCTTTCSPVIGNMVAYFDTFHVSATYSEYLSGVWATELKPLLLPSPPPSS